MSVLCLRDGCIFCVAFSALAFSYLFKDEYRTYATLKYCNVLSKLSTIKCHTLFNLHAFYASRSLCSLIFCKKNMQIHVDIDLDEQTLWSFIIIQHVLYL